MQQFRPQSFNILPPVIKNLLIVNVVMLIITMILGRQGEEFTNFLGLHYIKSDYFKPLQFFTHMFMHGGIMHLFSNMFALWMFGSMLENFWGPKRFLFFYIVSGLGAAVIHSAVVYLKMQSYQNEIASIISADSFDQAQAFVLKHRMYAEDCVGDWKEQLRCAVEAHGDIPTVGASGAVFGVLAAFGYLFPNTILQIIFLPIRFKAKYFVMMYAAFEIWAVIQDNPGDNVAHFAHLGGGLVGFLLVLYWNKTRRKDFF